MISICVTTYNRSKLLKNTITSIQNQTYKNIEVIIVDDCSSDNTQEIVKNEILPFDNRIIYIRHKKNMGLATARNTAIFKAKGKYFSFCDDDDIWKKNYLKYFLRVAKTYDEKYCFCSSEISFSNQNKVYSIEGSLKDLILLGYTPPVSGQFYFTQSLKNINGYNAKIRTGVDHDLWINLAMTNHRIIWLNRDLVHIRQGKNIDRMTSNFDGRIKGIQHTIEIWRNVIIKHFGNDFYNCFIKNYNYHNYKGFIIENYKNKSYLIAIKLFYKLPFAILVKDIKRFFIYRFNKNNILKNPTFFQCNKKVYTKLMKNISIRYKYN